jgi:hypothetical protein
MTLEVEDGTANANAESYISVADATTYHAARGNAAWAALATDAIREQHLRKATEHMLGEYRLKWAGVRLTATQALDWPRAYVPRQDYYVAVGTVDGALYYPQDEVPIEVARACAELALRSIDGVLAADATRAVRREKVDVLEVEYEPGAKDETKYTAVDALLRPFMRSGSGSMRLVRA